MVGAPICFNNRLMYSCLLYTSRLEGRGTDAPEVIESRIAKAEYALSFAPQFDCVIGNDDLETAKAEALKVIKKFLEA